nr:uncharacterized mitochondrial protein AtMg00810-like [Tanacetum cinerariifolium]
MWEAIERLQQGESLNIQDVKTNLFWEFSKFTSHDGETMESYYTRFYKLMNELIRNNLTEITKPITPPYKIASEEDIDPEQAQRDKDMQKNLALIAKYFKKIYKPTNNNLRTSSNSRNKNVDTTPRYKNDNHSRQFGNQRMLNVAGAREKVGSPIVQQSGIHCFNCREFRHFAKECRKPKRVKDFAYHKKKMLLCKQAEQGVPLQAEHYDWLADTDEEVDEQELEAHYSYMAKIQKVPTVDSGTDSEPNEQNDVESDDERVALANLIANLKLDVDENKKIQKQLKKANTSLAQELKECKAILTETICNEKDSNVFRKEREQYFKIQDLKSQLQDKNIAISELKKLIEKGKGKSMDTKFDRPSVVRQPNAQRIPKPSVLGKPAPFSNSLERIYFPKTKSVSKTNVSEDLSKPVTAQTLPQTVKKLISNTNVLKPGMYSIDNMTTHTRAPQLPQTVRNTNPHVSTSTGINHNTNISRPHLKSNQSRDKVLPNNSQVKVKKTQVEVYPRIPSVSNKMKPVTACEDSLNSKTLNANAFAQILGYGDLVQRNVTINRVYYGEGLNHNLFSVGQFCNADLEVAFRKSTCFVRDLHADADVPSQQELDLLFGPLYNEFFNPGSNPSTNIQSTSVPSTPTNVHAEENNNNQAKEGEHLQDDEFTNPFCAQTQEEAKSSSYNIEQVHGNPSRPVQTRRQLATDPEMCMYTLTVSTTEPKNIKEAMADSAWIEAMQEELHQFDKLQKRLPSQESSLWIEASSKGVGSSFELTAFLDVDHVGCIDSRKSTSGGIQFLGDKLLSWMSKNQNCTAISLAEAKYVSLSARCAQVMWMRTQLQDYGFNYNKIPLNEYQLVDMFTKALPEDRFKYLVERIVMRCLTLAELEVLAKESP